MYDALTVLPIETTSEFTLKELKIKKQVILLFFAFYFPLSPAHADDTQMYRLFLDVVNYYVWYYPIVIQYIFSYV